MQCNIQIHVRTILYNTYTTQYMRIVRVKLEKNTHTKMDGRCTDESRCCRLRAILVVGCFETIIIYQFSMFVHRLKIERIYTESTKWTKNKKLQNKTNTQLVHAKRPNRFYGKKCFQRPSNCQGLEANPCVLCTLRLAKYSDVCFGYIFFLLDTNILMQMNINWKWLWDNRHLEI